MLSSSASVSTRWTLKSSASSLGPPEVAVVVSGSSSSPSDDDEEGALSAGEKPASPGVQRGRRLVGRVSRTTCCSVTTGKYQMLLIIPLWYRGYIINNDDVK